MLIALGCLAGLVGILTASLAGIAIELIREGMGGRSATDLLRVALGVGEVVLLSLLLRWGVRRWVRRQPPDPPRRPEARPDGDGPP